MGYKSEITQKEYQKQWYQKNKARIDAKHKKYRKENKTGLLKWITELKSTLHCSRCPETHIACLQFHHRDPKTKRFTISFAVKYCVNKNEILAEIQKCDVLCANCHAKEHYIK